MSQRNPHKHSALVVGLVLFSEKVQAFRKKDVLNLTAPLQGSESSAALAVTSVVNMQNLQLPQGFPCLS